MESIIAKIVLALGAISFILFTFVAMKKKKLNDLTIAALISIVTLIAMFILWEFLHPTLQILTLIYEAVALTVLLILGNSLSKQM